jgi:signal peptidase I
MNDEPRLLIRRRIPAVAALLSFVFPGLGQIYCGRFNRGIVVCAVGAIFTSFALFALGGVGEIASAVGWGSLVLTLAVWAYAVVDAERLAKRSPADYVLKEYNRWYVYASLVILVIPISLTWAFYLRAGVVEAFRVASGSMMPTLQPGERVLANKTVYRSEPVLRGDVVVFLNPNQRSQKQIKRIVALPGDRVEMKDGQLILNGAALERTPIPASEQGAEHSEAIVWERNGSARYQILLAAPDAPPPQTDGVVTLLNLPPLTVPNGQCIVLGDNRSKSVDSRSYGLVPLADVLGRVDHVYWPHWRFLGASEQ